MRTVFMSMNDIVKDVKSCPFPVGVIPDNMGINLCAVDGISWQRQDDGQLVNISIYFHPADPEEYKKECDTGGEA